MAITSGGKTKLTSEDHALFPQDGRRHEIVDGEHLVSPAPARRHQRVSMLLAHQLVSQVWLAGRGEVYGAPFDLHLSDTDVVQPDLLVVLQDRLDILTPERAAGAPDLVVEILSPATAGRDCLLKRELYERAGVPEYWLVDADANVVSQLVLEEGRYRLAGRHSESLLAQALPDVVVDLTKVW